MQNIARLGISFLCTVVLAAPAAGAQSAARDSSGTVPQRRSSVLIAVIGGPGIETPTPYVFRSDGNLYQTQKRPMVFELELSKSILSSAGKQTYFEYFVAIQPAITVGGNVRYLFRPCEDQSCFDIGTKLVEQRYTSYGIGITPFGGRMMTALPFGAKFSAAAGAGTVWLNQPIPYNKAKRLNFQLSARPAIGVPIRNFGTLWAGFEYLHVSNANTSPINPGINAGLVMFGFQRSG